MIRMGSEIVIQGWFQNDLRQIWKKKWDRSTGVLYYSLYA